MKNTTPHKYATSCVLGLRHFRNGGSNQSRVFASRKAVGGIDTYAIALSDGMTRAPLSEAGSSITVSTIGNYLLDHFDELVALPEKEIKTRLIFAIIEAEKRYLLDHFDDLERIKRKQKDYDAFLVKYISRVSPEEINYLYGLRQMFSTILFAAKRGTRSIYGKLGDGYILRLDANERFENCLAEHSDKERVFTIYPGLSYFKSRIENDPKYLEEIQIKIEDRPTNAYLLLSDLPEASLYADKSKKRLAPFVFSFLDATIEKSRGDAEAFMSSYIESTLRLSTTKSGGNDIALALLTSLGDEKEVSAPKNVARPLPIKEEKPSVKPAIKKETEDKKKKPEPKEETKMAKSAKKPAAKKAAAKPAAKKPAAKPAKAEKAPTKKAVAAKPAKAPAKKAPVAKAAKAPAKKAVAAKPAAKKASSKKSAPKKERRNLAEFKSTVFAIFLDDINLLFSDLLEECKGTKAKVLEESEVAAICSVLVNEGKIKIDRKKSRKDDPFYRLNEKYIENEE